VFVLLLLMQQPHLGLAPGLPPPPPLIQLSTSDALEQSWQGNEQFDSLLLYPIMSTASPSDQSEMGSLCKMVLFLPEQYHGTGEWNWLCLTANDIR
jgi:hypothetical protein